MIGQLVTGRWVGACACACVREFVRNRGPLKLPNVLHKVNHLVVSELVRVCLYG